MQSATVIFHASPARQGRSCLRSVDHLLLISKPVLTYNPAQTGHAYRKIQIMDKIRYRDVRLLAHGSLDLVKLFLRQFRLSAPAFRARMQIPLRILMGSQPVYFPRGYAEHVRHLTCIAVAPVCVHDPDTVVIRYHLCSHIRFTSFASLLPSCKGYNPILTRLIGDLYFAQCSRNVPGA